MKSYLRLISTGTTGARCDVTPLFGDYMAFSALVNDIGSHFDAGTIAGVAAINMDDNAATRRIRATYNCYSASDGG